MPDSEVEVAGRRFSVGRMPPLDQFHVMRRYSKVIDQLRRSAEEIPDSLDGESDEDAQRRVSSEIGFKLMQAWGAVSEDEANYVLDRCLSRVRVFVDTASGGNWAQLWNAATKRLMFEDVPYEALLTLVMYAVQENLTPSSPGSGSG